MGRATLYVSSKTPTVSSVSKTWINAVAKDPSFRHVQWDSEIQTTMTTLDQLIEEYGLPDFCKLDIEGHELEALRGLSAELPALSFEFLPATITSAEQCIHQLETIGHYEYNWAVAEQFQLQSPAWLTPETMILHLSDKLPKGKSGDIYARRKL